MKKRCPFLMGASCYGADCALWREEVSGAAYCGAGGPLASAAVKPEPEKVMPAPAPATILAEKRPGHGGGFNPPRHTRR